MKPLHVAGAEFKAFYRALISLGLDPVWGDEPGYADVTADSMPITPADVLYISDTASVVLDGHVTLEANTQGRRIQRLFKDWRSGRFPPGVGVESSLAMIERVIVAAQIMTPSEAESLKSWEAENIGPDRKLSTSDWPGWKSIIARLQQ